MLLLLLASLAVVAAHALAVRFRHLTPPTRALGLLGLLVLGVLGSLLRPEAAVLQKLVGRLLMPAGLLWIAGWATGLMALRRSPRLGLGLLTGWALYSIAGNEYVGARLVHRLEAPHRAARPFEEAPFEAVFVFGGGVVPSPDGEGQLGASGDRAALAARLYHAGVAPLLYTSGRSVPGMGPAWESGPVTAHIWRSLGVADEAIVVVEGAHNTAMEAEAFASIVRERGFRRVGLSSSAWHLPRVMHLAARAGLPGTPLPADFRGEPAYHGLVTLVPVGPGFDAVHRACWELLGSLHGVGRGAAHP